MMFLNNVKWVTISQVVKISCQLIGMTVFSRFLSTHEFGLMSMTLVVCGFINIIRDLGFTAAIIQRDDISEEFKSSVFYFNLLIGVILFLVVYLSAPLIAEFFKEKDLKTVLQVIAIAFPINSITSINLSLLERESRFFEVAKSESVSSLLALIIAIALAVMNFGVYSLVAQTILYSFLSGLGFIIATRWKPKLRLSFKDISDTFSFSFNLVIFNFINYFSRNSDQIIIGRFFNASILGQYSLAYRIMLFPLQNITYVLTRSLYPVLSRNKNKTDQNLELYLNTLKVIAAIVSPLMLGLASVSNDFVVVVFGAKWDLIPGIIIWLAPTAILQAQVSTTGAVFMSQGKTGLLVKLTIFNAILQIAAFVIGGFWDVLVLIKLYFIANVIMFLPNMHKAVKCFNGSLVDVFVNILKPIVFSIIMYTAIIIINEYLFDSLIDSKVITLVASIFIGVVIYLLMILFFDRSILRDLKNIRSRS